MNRKQIAKEIDSLARLKGRIAVLQIEEQKAVAILKKAGGGESVHWLAKLVKMPQKTVVIKAHKQLRLYAQS